MKKSKKEIENLRLFAAIFLGIIFLTLLVFAAENTPVLSSGGDTLKVTLYASSYGNQGDYFTNTGGSSIFVPLGTFAEYDSFRTKVMANLISGVSYCAVANGGWSAWTDWGACSVSCGGGTQSRTRTCTNPAPVCGGSSCTGDNTETQACNTQTCCVSHSYSQCYSGNRWWYNSCGAVEDLRESCSYGCSGDRCLDYCENTGGTEADCGGVTCCKFSSSSCPSGWAQYQSWSECATTLVTTCNIAGTGCPLSFCQITLPGHGWANQGCAGLPPWPATPYCLQAGGGSVGGCNDPADSCCCLSCCASGSATRTAIGCIRS